MKVSFAEFTHTGKGIDTFVSIPLGVGQVAANAIKHLGDAIDVEMFKYPQDFTSFLSRETPGIAGFSNYMWNDSLNHEFARRIKEHSPRTIIIFGGPNFPAEAEEQEAYLLPTLQQRHSFGEQRELEPGLRLLWTPGPTPGSCCLHWAQGGRDVLFCGRLLWPRGLEDVEMRIGDSTFHASRQQRSVGRLKAWLKPGQPAQIACAAGLGVLRGIKLVERGNVAIDTVIARN